MEKQMNVFGEPAGQYNENHLWRWIKYLKRRGLDFDFWFDTSSPYDNEVNIRTKGHKCHVCVTLRFDSKKKMRAYDSNFDQGTTFVDLNEIETEVVDKIIKKIGSKECEKANWNNNNGKLPLIKDNWLMRDEIGLAMEEEDEPE